MACRSFTNDSSDPGKCLIVLSAPSAHNSYYRSKFEDIIQFCSDFVTRVKEKDNVIILCSKGTSRSLQQRGIPKDVLLEKELEDIWIRDFSTVGLCQQVGFKFRPKYLKIKTADLIQKSYHRFANKFGLKLGKQSDIILDGGNVVDNLENRAIISTRILSDNNIASPDSQTFLEKVQNILEMEITLIDEPEDDVTGHSDGIVSFIDSNVLAVGEPNEERRNKIVELIDRNFGSTVKCVNVPSTYTDGTWRNFPSAAGLWVNSLLTTNFLYVPTFGHDPANQNDGITCQMDEQALELIRNNTSKSVVAVPVSKAICEMGGSVRCLTWLMQGDNANKLIEAARTN